MAPRTSRGRKPTKNATATSLLNALTFMSALKPPTGQALQPYMQHVFLNGGWAIGFDGILAMGQKIEDGIAGYVNTKLFAEALENTGKIFTLSVTSAGHFHVQSDTYEALVPALDPTTVPQTFPDANLYPLADGKAFVEAATAAAKVVSDNAESVLYASIRLNGATVMATDGVTVIEAYHGNIMPVGVVVPKVFVTAMAKTGKTPVGFGLANDWQTLTVHFEDQSWLRTNCFDPASWSSAVLDIFAGLFNGIVASDVEPKLFDAVAAILPFAEDDNRVIIRPGLIRTHPDKTQGASLALDSVNFTIDLNGKRLLAVRDHVTQFAIGGDQIADSGQYTERFVFYGGNVRGVIGGMDPLPEPVAAAPAQGGWAAPAAAQGGWGAPAPAATPAPAQGGWDTPSATQTVAPPADPAPQGWNTPEPTKPNHTVADPAFKPGLAGVPAGGLAGDPEYEAARTGERTADDVDQTSNFDIGGWMANLPADTGDNG